jgi:hypothetical protein
VVQARRVGKLPAKLRAHARFERDVGDVPHDSQQPSVAVVRWPLSTEQYLRLIRRSHIGLFLYDADEYFARCSGVLVEMLKAAVPVIVPAGCWMSEQISEHIFAHRERVLQTAAIVTCMTAADADWEAGRAQRYYIWRRDARLLVGGDGNRLAARLRVPPGATDLCVRFRWSAGTTQGSFVEVAVTHDGEHEALNSREIVGVRADGAPVSVVLPISLQARQIRLQWRNAFCNHTMGLEELEFIFLSASSKGIPLGSVGLIAAGIDQVPRLLRNMAEHYQHYRQSAESFAPQWGQWHSPDTVVRLLTDARQAPARNQRFAA